MTMLIRQGMSAFQHTAARRRLGQQNHAQTGLPSFNTQPPEGGWIKRGIAAIPQVAVSTHSRPKAAGSITFSRPITNTVSTHSRPKAAGSLIACMRVAFWAFQHTAARRRLGKSPLESEGYKWFQHTAARRRLADCDCF